MVDVHLPVLPETAEKSRAAMAADLARVVRGEVRFSRHDRLLYATDASIYQVEPLGVIVPRDLHDVSVTVEYCRRNGIALLPRGGGTALAGQSVNRAIIIDFSAYCTGILKIDPAARSATVEPGVILAQLNQALQPHRLLFGPDVATATHANIGGMVGNNSAGAHSILYGRTVDHLIGVEALLADGSHLHFFENAAARDPKVAELTRRVAEIVLPLQDQIDERFPKILRRCGGYNLDLILAQLRTCTAGTFDRVNLAHLLCGSEGTLAVTTGAKLHLVDAPQAKALAIVAFSSVEDSLRAVADILETKPAAVELVDDVIINLASRNREYRHYVDLMPAQNGRTPDAVLYVEYFAADADAANQKLDALRRVCAGRAVKTFTDPAAMIQAWKLRAAGEPLLHGLPGDRKPLTFVEDAAVDPARLCEFVGEFRRIVESHGTTAAWYAHASVGCLHVRPMINLRDAADRRAMASIAEHVADLASSFGGSISGEHGDGRLRSHLLERFYGPEIVQAFRAIKQLFDPHNLLNPGNIVSPLPMQENLRVRPGETFINVPPVETFYRYDRDGGFGPAVEMCNGAGVCRKRSGGTMCPSYRGTLDERHATRGRGNALRLAITGQLAGGSAPGWNDAETLRTLDLCLSCKACKSECPSNVDIAKLKAEYLAHSHEAAGRVPLRSRVFGNIRALNRAGSAVHPLANALAPAVKSVAGSLLGLDRRRSIPRFERSLYRWFNRRRSPVQPDAPAVILFPDCFTVYNEPAIGQAAVHVLERLGYRVVLPRVGCCGRSLLSVGMLRQAQRTCSQTANALLEVIDRERALAVVGCEPSCVSAIIDDWPELKLDPDRTAVQHLADMTASIESFVHLRWEEHPAPWSNADAASTGSVLLHGHCHQKALWGVDDSIALLARLFDDRAGLIDAGCCGMAGSFGYTADHYDLSMRIGELQLMPAIRDQPQATILAPGTSCRHQIKDATGRAALHPIQLIAQTCC